MNAIEIEGLSKTYDNGVVGLESVRLSIRRGEVFGYLGPNGSGKTTTVRLLNGTLRPSSGSFSVLGLKGDNESDTVAIRSKTATLSESANMYEQLSAWDNLMFFSKIYDIPSKESGKRAEILLREMDLWEKKDLKLGSFSTGMKKRIHLIRTMLHRPEIIFLDEPTSGLDPESSKHVLSLVRKLAKEEGTTIFMCTHNIPQAEGICDSFGFLKQGKLITSGGKETLLQSIRKKLTVRIKTGDGIETIEVGDEEEIHHAVHSRIDRGMRIYEVVQLRPSLEEMYFHYIGKDTNDV